MGTALAVLLFFAFIGCSMYINTSIENKANEKAKMIYAHEKELLLKDVLLEKEKIESKLQAKKVNMKIDLMRYEITEKERIESELKGRRAAVEEGESGLAYQREVQKKLFEEKTIGFPWVAKQYALIKTAR